MPLRYAEETKLISAVDLICRIIAKCDSHIGAHGVGNLPIFGGWEVLISDFHDGSSDDGDTSSVPPVDLNFVEPEGSEADDDSSDEDVETVTLEPARREGLPPWWTKVVQELSSGRKVPHSIGRGPGSPVRIFALWSLRRPSSQRLVL